MRRLSYDNASLTENFANFNDKAAAFHDDDDSSDDEWASQITTQSSSTTTTTQSSCTDDRMDLDDIQLPDTQTPFAETNVDDLGEGARSLSAQLLFEQTNSKDAEDSAQHIQKDHSYSARRLSEEERQQPSISNNNNNTHGKCKYCIINTVNTFCAPCGHMLCRSCWDSWVINFRNKMYKQYNSIEIAKEKIKQPDCKECGNTVTSVFNAILPC